MSENWWDGVATEFVSHYYTQFDTSLEGRAGLANLYQADSMMTFNGEPVQGPEGIGQKFQSLTFKSVSHQPSAINAQPAPNGGVIVMVSGMLQTDEDDPLPFAQVFHLLPAGDSYYVYNDIFNLVVFA